MWRQSFHLLWKCIGSSITMVIRGPDLKAKSSWFYQMLFYNVAYKGYCPFWSSLAYYSLNQFSSRDHKFFHSFSERLRVMCLRQVADLNHSYVWPTLGFFILISLWYLLVILLIVFADSVNISNGYNFAKVSDIQICLSVPRNHKMAEEPN